MLLRAIFLVLLAGSIGFVSLARAETTNLCGALLQFERLPADVADVGSGRQELGNVLIRIANVERAIRSPVFTDVLLSSQLVQFESIVSAMRQQLMASSISTSSNSNSLAPKLLLSHRASLNGLINHYKCMDKAPQSIGDDSGLTGLEGQRLRPIPSLQAFSPLNPDNFTNYLIVFAFAGLLLMLLRCSKKSNREEIQVRSSANALITFGDNCTVTHFLRVGPRGALLEAPSEKISSTSLAVYAAGHRIEAIHSWANHNFLELIFPNPISAEAVKDIVEASHAEDQLEQVAKNATECFFPGCHLDCEKHRETQISMRMP